MVTQHASRIDSVHVCVFSEGPHICIYMIPGVLALELEYLFGIDCTPVSLRFFQEFEPYDPWH